MIKSLLFLFFRKDDSSFLKERSKELVKYFRGVRGIISDLPDKSLIASTPIARTASAIGTGECPARDPRENFAGRLGTMDMVARCNRDGDAGMGRGATTMGVGGCRSSDGSCSA